jgi:hypothetical protein
MARVKYPLMSEQATGTVGGLTFRNNGYGPCVSARPVSPHLRTPIQTVRRGQLSQAHRAWEALSDSDRAAWESVRIPPASGRNLYIGCYCRAAIAGSTPSNKPNRTPSNGRITEPEVIYATTNPCEMLLHWTWTGTQNSMLFIYQLSTFSGRETPKPRKLLWAGAGNDSDQWAGINPTFPAPVVHVRFDFLHPLDWRLTGHKLMRFEPVWT